MTLFGNCGEACKVVGVTAYVLCMQRILVGGIEKWGWDRGRRRGYIGRGRDKEINQQLNGVTAPSGVSCTKHMRLGHEQIEESETLMSTSPSLLPGEGKDMRAGAAAREHGTSKQKENKQKGKGILHT